MKVVVAVTNDLSFDQRVRKVCNSLHEEGMEITLVGRCLPSSVPVDRCYRTKRFSLVFNKGALFYASYNLRLFWFLLFQKVDVIHSNDLDTLLACYLAAKLKGKTLIYDSHEYFLGVPEIQGRIVKKVWKSIEARIFPKLKHVFTVNDSIANLYLEDYGKKVSVMRNIPEFRKVKKVKTREDLELPLDKKIVILQGAGINVDRGAEELLEAISGLENSYLVIAGSGDVIDDLKRRAAQNDLVGKVKFTGKLDYDEMMQYTLNADVGVTLDKDTNVNYKFSLPNKVFDYLRAGLPIVSSDLVELKKVVLENQCGVITNGASPKDIRDAIEFILKPENYQEFKSASEASSDKYGWENEVVGLRKLYRSLKV